MVIMVGMLKKVKKFEEVEKIIKNEQVYGIISYAYGPCDIYITDNIDSIINSGIDIIYNRFSIMKD